MAGTQKPGGTLSYLKSGIILGKQHEGGAAINLVVTSNLRKRFRNTGRSFVHRGIHLIVLRTGNYGDDMVKRGGLGHISWFRGLGLQIPLAPLQLAHERSANIRLCNGCVSSHWSR